jgi:hypothetical protein
MKPVIITAIAFVFVVLIGIVGNDYSLIVELDNSKRLKMGYDTVSHSNQDLKYDE